MRAGIGMVRSPKANFPTALNRSSALAPERTYARAPEVTHGEFEVPTAPSLGIEFGITNEQ